MMSTSRSATRGASPRTGTPTKSTRISTPQKSQSGLSVVRRGTEGQTSVRRSSAAVGDKTRRHTPTSQTYGATSNIANANNNNNNNRGEDDRINGNTSLPTPSTVHLNVAQQSTQFGGKETSLAHTTTSNTHRNTCTSSAGLHTSSRVTPAGDNNEDAACLTAVSKALTVIVKEHVSITSDTESEVVELLDLAVDVFRSVTHPSEGPEGREGGGRGGAAAAAARAYQRVGVLARYCGIFEAIGLFLPLRLVVSSRLRVSCLRTLLTIIQICGDSDSNAKALEGAGGAAESLRTVGVTTVFDANSIISSYSMLISEAIAVAFEPQTYFDVTTGRSADGLSQSPSRVARGAATGGVGGLGYSGGNGIDLPYSLAVLSCDSSGATSESARAIAAEALAFAASTWPFLISDSFVPTMGLTCHHTALVASQRLMGAYSSPPLFPLFSSHSPTETDAEGETVFGSRDSADSNEYTLAEAILVNATEIDGLIGDSLRVQLSALTRLIGKHDPQLLLRRVRPWSWVDNEEADELKYEQNNGRSKAGSFVSFVSSNIGRDDEVGGRPPLANINSSRIHVREGKSSPSRLNSSRNIQSQRTTPQSCPQRIVSFLNPRGTINEALVTTVLNFVTFVNNYNDSNERQQTNARDDQPIGFSALVNPNRNVLRSGGELLSSSEMKAMEQKIKTYVLLLDTLTDLLSASADTIQRQDTSCYWREIVAVPRMADAFIRTVDWCLGITTRYPKDLPAGCARLEEKANTRQGNTREEIGEDGEDLSETVAGDSNKNSTADANNNKTIDHHRHAISALSHQLHTLGEGLLFAAGISLAKTALLLEGQYYSSVTGRRQEEGEGEAAADHPRRQQQQQLPLITYRLLVGLDPSASATLTFSGHTLPNVRVWESYFVRAADTLCFSPAWHRALHDETVRGRAAGRTAHQNSFASSPLSPAVVLDPTKAHRGLERLRLLRFAVAHAFTAHSIHLLELVMGGGASGLQHASQAASLAQQRLRDVPAEKTKVAIRAAAAETFGFPSRSAEETTSSARGGAEGGGGGSGWGIAHVAGEGDSSATSPKREYFSGLHMFLRTVAVTVDKCSEALLVESSLLIGIMLAKSPTLRANVSRFAVGYESWASQLCASIESVVVHPRIEASVLRRLVLVDVCQCILNDGEQAQRVDTFDAKRVAAAIIREQEKRRLIAEAEALRRERRNEDDVVLGHGGHSGENDPSADQFTSQEDHDLFCRNSERDCGSRFHYRGLSRASRASSASSMSPTRTAAMSSPHRRRPPPPPTSVHMQPTALDLATVHFLLTYQAALPSATTPSSLRVDELTAALAREILVASTRVALIDGPRQIKAKEISASAAHQHQHQRGYSGTFPSNSPSRFGSGSYSVSPPRRRGSHIGYNESPSAAHSSTQRNGGLVDSKAFFSPAGRGRKEDTLVLDHTASSPVPAPRTPRHDSFSTNHEGGVDNGGIEGARERTTNSNHFDPFRDAAAAPVDDADDPRRMAPNTSPSKPPTVHESEAGQSRHDAGTAEQPSATAAMTSDYDRWLASRQRSSKRANSAAAGTRSITTTFVAPFPHSSAYGGGGGRGKAEPFRPTSTAPKRSLTPSVAKMAPPTSTRSSKGKAMLGNSVAPSPSSVAAAAAGVGADAMTVAALLANATANTAAAGGGEAEEDQEYVSISIMMHLPISYGPHYERSKKAAVRHIKHPKAGISFVQPVLRDTSHSWSASDVFVGEVYVLFLPFHRISSLRLAEEVATVQRHMLDVKRKLVTTPTTLKSRRWFLSDMLNYILPRTEMLLVAFKTLIDRHSAPNVVEQLRRIKVLDEAKAQNESVFEAAVSCADLAMPREVLRLSSRFFRDVVHSGNISFAVSRLREVYSSPNAAAAVHAAGGGMRFGERGEEATEADYRAQRRAEQQRREYEGGGGTNSSFTQRGWRAPPRLKGMGNEHDQDQDGDMFAGMTPGRAAAATNVKKGTQRDSFLNNPFSEGASRAFPVGEMGEDDDAVGGGFRGAPLDISQYEESGEDAGKDGMSTNAQDDDSHLENDLRQFVSQAYGGSL